MRRFIIGATLAVPGMLIWVVSLCLVGIAYLGFLSNLMALRITAPSLLWSGVFGMLPAALGAVGYSMFVMAQILMGDGRYKLPARRIFQIACCDAGLHLILILGITTLLSGVILLFGSSSLGLICCVAGMFQFYLFYPAQKQVKAWHRQWLAEASNALRPGS